MGKSILSRICGKSNAIQSKCVSCVREYWDTYSIWDINALGSRRIREERGQVDLLHEVHARDARLSKTHGKKCTSVASFMHHTGTISHQLRVPSYPISFMQDRHKKRPKILHLVWYGLPQPHTQYRRSLQAASLDGTAFPERWCMLLPWTVSWPRCSPSL